MTTLDQIKEEVRLKGSTDALMKSLNDYIDANPRDDEALTFRGMQYWNRNERALAINDYLAAIKINPDSKAKLALKATNDILDYYNKDLYNP